MLLDNSHIPFLTLITLICPSAKDGTKLKMISLSLEV